MDKLVLLNNAGMTRLSSPKPLILLGLMRLLLLYSEAETTFLIVLFKPHSLKFSCF